VASARKITLLGAGLIGTFYTMTLHGARSRDRVHTVCAATDEEARAFASKWGIPRTTSDIVKAVEDPESPGVRRQRGAGPHPLGPFARGASRSAQRLVLGQGHRKGWLFPVGDEVHALGYVHMFADQFDALDAGWEPRETFFDGYVVNAIIDACYRSAASKKWEPVDLAVWKISGSEASRGRGAERPMRPASG